MYKEYFISPYAMVLRDAPHSVDQYSAQHFNDYYDLFLKKFVALKDDEYSVAASAELTVILRNILEIKSRLDQ